MKEIFVGIDVGKRFHYIFAQDEKGTCLYHGEIEQDQTKLCDVFYKLKELGDVHVVVDQPHNIGSLCLMCADYCGCRIGYIASQNMRKAAEMLGKTTKTDRIDAEVIAYSARVLPEIINPVKIKDALRQNLKALKSYDLDLRYDEVRAKNRLRAALVEDFAAFETVLVEARLESSFALEALIKFGGPWNMKDHLRAFKNFCGRFCAKVPSGLVEDMYSALDNQTIKPYAADMLESLTIPSLAQDLVRIKAKRKEIDRRIEMLLEHNEDFILLNSIPGIGTKIASELVAEIDIACFRSAAELASYAGIAPRVRNSGTSIRSTRASKSGNRRLKDAFFHAARCSVQRNPLSYEFYTRKRAEGKSYAAALMALARKLCKIVFAVLKYRQPYREQLCSTA